MAGSPPLWRVERDGSHLHLFAARPPLPMAWSAPRAESVLDAAAEFWNETPEVTPASQALAFQHGLDPTRPLATRLSPELRVRLDAATKELGVAPALLAQMRPWLAAQLLRRASEMRRGVERGSAPDAVFRARAEQSRIPIRSEFATMETLLEFFTGLPAQAAAELLAVELDDLAASPDEERLRAERWLAGDLALEERASARIEREHPAFYEHLAVARNRAWLPRIDALLRAGTRAFVLVGVGHLVGRENLVELLVRAGCDVQRD